MAQISESILNQMSRAGQPRTSTTTTSRDEPFDIGGLGMLIWLLMQDEEKKKEGGPLEVTGTTPLGQSSNPLEAIMAAVSPGGNTPQSAGGFDLSQNQPNPMTMGRQVNPLEMIMKIIGGGSGQ